MVERDIYDAESEHNKDTEKIDLHVITALLQNLINKANDKGVFGEKKELDLEKVENVQSKLMEIFDKKKPAHTIWREHYRKIFNKKRNVLSEYEKCYLFIKSFMSVGFRLNQWVEGSISGSTVEGALAHGKQLTQVIQQFAKYIEGNAKNPNYRFDFNAFEYNIRLIIDAISKRKTITYRQPNADSAEE